MPAKRHTRENCPYSDDFAVISSDVNRMKEDIKEVKDSVKHISEQLQALPDKLEGKFVTRSRFEIIEKVVYGGLGSLLLAMLAYGLKVVFGW